MVIKTELIIGLNAQIAALDGSQTRIDLLKLKKSAAKHEIDVTPIDDQLSVLDAGLSSADINTLTVAAEAALEGNSSGGSGGGLPINSVVPLNSEEVIYTSNEGTWLKSGHLEGDTLSYPDANPIYVTAAAYTGVSFPIPPEQTSNPKGMHITDDGYKLYIITNYAITTPASLVFQYTLSVPFNTSTATYDNKSFDGSAQGTTGRDVHLNSDGTKMTILDSDGYHQFSLSTPFDITTAVFIPNTTVLPSYVGITFSFKPDGTAIYTNKLLDTIEIPLSTPFDLSTAGAEIVHDLSSVLLGMQDTGYTMFSVDGTKLYFEGRLAVNSFNVLRVYDVGIPFDLSSITVIEGSEVKLNTQTNAGFDGFAMDSYNTILYFISSNADTIFQYAPFSGIGITEEKFDTVTGLPIYLRIK